MFPLMNTSTFPVPHRFLSCLAAILLGLSLLGGLPARAADPLEPEKAFVLSARALDAASVEVEFNIATDYYLYSDRFKFEVEAAAVKPGEVVRPPGKMKIDPYFGEVETYRGNLRMLLPVEVPPGLTRFVLIVTSQGCWDGGICYPPTPQRVEIDLRASPATRGSSLLERAFSSTDTATYSQPPAPEAGGDESGRIAGLLFSARDPLVLLSFFGLGLLLAFTPCTFPMIPILSGIIVGTGRPVSRGRALALSGAYVLGMALTYAAAGVVAGLTGTLLAAVLQNVWVLTAFALLFVVLALSMFGFFELQLPTALQSRLADSANREKGGHLGGVAVMGVLSALIVGPCVTAPLAGALLYIAKTGDAVMGGFALFVLALGMGVPLIVIALAARSVLPRIGPWMEGVKKAAGVLLLAVALWVVSPVLPAFATMLGWALLLLFSGIFLSALDPLPPTAKAWTRFWKGVGVTLLVAGIAMLVGTLAGSRDPLQPLAVLRTNAAAVVAPAFEPVASMAELDARLAATERPVMLDFYADWCVSCKEMERDTFTDPAVAAKMGQMLRLQADVTAANAEHRALLARFGLFGPPGIVFFDARGKERTGLRVVGFVSAAEFGAVLDSALQ
jgi:thiol:disulfide interchange protein DsbD